MFWLRGTNVKSNRQQETVRVSAVHVHGLNNGIKIYLKKKKMYFWKIKFDFYPSEHLLQRGALLSSVQTTISK